MKNHELDAVDRTILNILQRNAKCPLKEDCREGGICLHRLYQRGLKRWKRRIYSRLSGTGESGSTWISYQGTDQSGGFAGGKNVFYPFVRKCSNVIECNCVTGEYSMVLEVLFPSTTELDKFIGELQRFGRTKEH